MDLISLATDFLSTPKGKLLLGEEINIAGITSRIQELSTTYNIDLVELASSTLSEKTDALTQTKKVDKTLTAKERIKAKSSQLDEDKKNDRAPVEEEDEFKALVEEHAQDKPINETEKRPKSLDEMRAWAWGVAGQKCANLQILSTGARDKAVSK